jgi:hypothetical protein
MWRILPLCLLVACAAIDPNRSTSGGGGASAQPHIIRALQLPLQPPTLIVQGEPSKWTFRDFNVSGWVDENGFWDIRSEISHGRIPCATYEVGVQLGRGRPACSNVDWLTNVEYGSRVRHCNSATRIHSGGGRFFDTSAVEAANCARVVVRCDGC